MGTNRHVWCPLWEALEPPMLPSSYPLDTAVAKSRAAYRPQDLGSAFTEHQKEMLVDAKVMSKSFVDTSFAK